MKLNHRERLETILAGEKPDRTPIAFWHHLPVDDQDPDRLAAATIAFQKQFDFDLVKVSPPSSFCLKDWGAKDEWQGNYEGTRDYTQRVIQHPEDWSKLKILDPKEGYLGQQLECLKILNLEYGDKTPFIQTIFNPLSQAKNLAGKDNLPIHIRKYPEALHEGLKIIQETTTRFINETKKCGISGIFYAVQHATHQILTPEEYREFGRAYDLPLLDAASDLWVNMVHIHGSDIMFDLMADYPVQIMNWHDRETSPSLREGLEKYHGIVCGGIGRIETLVLGTPEKIREEASDAYAQTGGKRLILGTGCVLPLTTPYGNIMAARKFAEELV